jgi:hypothetical protein
MVFPVLLTGAESQAAGGRAKMGARRSAHISWPPVGRPAQLTVDLAAVPDVDHQDHKLIVPDLVNDPVVTHPDAQDASHPP